MFETHYLKGEGIMPGIRVISSILLTVCMIAINSNKAEASEIRWPDHLTPLHNIRVFDEDERKIFVDLPEEFLKGKEVIISITLLSQLYNLDAGFWRPSFKLIKPSLRFNRNTRADYEIPVEDFPSIQKFELKIKTSHLKAGENLVKVVFEWVGMAECSSEVCSYLVLDMCFKNKASSDDPWKSSPKPPSDVPEESTKVVKSDLGFYELWYDPEKWTQVVLEDSKKNDIDIRLINNIEGNYVEAIASDRVIDSSSVAAHVEKILNNIIPDSQLVWKQVTATKNRQIHIIKREGDVQGFDFVSYGFYWVGSSGFFAFFTHIQKKFSEDYEKDLTDLIKGLVVNRDSGGLRQPRKLAEERTRLEAKRQKAEQDRKQVASISQSPTKTETGLLKSPNGIIYDPKTNLEWFVGPDEDTDFADAEEWVKKLKVGGGGWRMTTRSELESLYNKGVGERNMDPTFNTTGWNVRCDPSDTSDAQSFNFKLGHFNLRGGNVYVDPSSTRVFAVRPRR